MKTSSASSTRSTPARSESKKPDAGGLARRHAWANWISGDELIRAVPSHKRARTREVAADLADDRYTVHRPGRGFKLDHARIDGVAELLRDQCGYGAFRIEATLSRFDGFDA